MSIVLSKVFHLLCKPDEQFHATIFFVSFICLLSLGKMPTNTTKLKSFIRGYHGYQAVWGPKLRDIYKLMREPTNEKDVNAVADVRPNPDPAQIFIQIS